MSKMNKEEHAYFHTLMWYLTGDIEPKFAEGCVNHRDKGMLWDMSDEQLDEEIANELRDLMVYYAEKLRRTKIH